MKLTFITATALALILSGSAYAARDHGGGGGSDHGTVPAPTATPAAPPPAHADGADGGRHAPTGRTGGADRTPFGGGTGGATPHDRGNVATPPVGGGTAGHAPRGGRNNGNTPFGGGSRRGGHAGRNHNTAFDALRRAFNAPRHYHHGRYNRPSGWYAHQWTYGEFLPSLFFGRSYWIDDYDDFGLGDPPDGTVWVRYGNDALLIDEDSGEVIQAVYGVFY